MPLSIGATWPTLRSGGTAAAADMTSKFEWLEGDRLPMSGGVLTTSVFNIGSDSYRWGGYFVEIDSASVTFDTINGGQDARAWANINVAGGTITTAQSFNISSWAYSPGFPGLYQGVVENVATFLSITSTTFSMNKHTPKASTPFISNLDFSAHRFKTTSVNGTATDSSFCAVWYGPLNFRM